MQKPSFYNYVKSSSSNYGLNSLCFVDIHSNQFYYSYQTLIAVRIAHSDELIILQNYWNNTTAKHLNAISTDKSIRLTKEDFNKRYNELFNNGDI